MASKRAKATAMARTSASPSGAACMRADSAGPLWVPLPVYSPVGLVDHWMDLRGLLCQEQNVRFFISLSIYECIHF